MRVFIHISEANGEEMYLFKRKATIHEKNRKNRLTLRPLTTRDSYRFFHRDKPIKGRFTRLAVRRWGRSTFDQFMPI